MSHNLHSTSRIFTKILPNLYLTGQDGITTYNIHNHRITGMLSIVHLPPPIFQGVQTYVVKLDDTSDLKIGRHINFLCDKIAEMHRKHKNVVVHCTAGINRSAAIVIAYLMKYKGLDLYASFSYVKLRRPMIQPEEDFLKHLIAFELEIYEDNSATVAKQRDANGAFTATLIPRRR